MTNTPDIDAHEHLAPIGTSTDLAAAPVKPGWKTTEFWLKVAAFGLTALFASGTIPTSGPIAQVTAISATMLGALGYTVSRTLVKNASVLLLVLAVGLGVATMACGSTSKSSTLKNVGNGALAAAEDCTTPDRVKLEAQFGPTVEAALQRAIGMNGKIDLPSFDQIGHSLEADGWCVLEQEAAKLIAWAATKVPNAPAAATAPFDANDLAAKLGAMRAAKFPGVRFQVGAVQ